MFVARLSNDGYSEENSERISSQLETASRHRLVLLVPSGIEDVTFEVQSLQEYMAARALSDGNIESVLDRIRILAPSAYWRHTLRLTLGRVYSQRTQDRDALVTTLMSLDSDDQRSRFLGYGAQIATDLLRDDFAISKPLHRRLLLTHALSQLQLWPIDDHRHLASLCRVVLTGGDSEAATLVEAKLREAISSSAPAHLSANIILKNLLRTKGKSRAFAKRTLAQTRDQQWDNVDRALPGSTSVGDLFDAAAPHADLTVEEAANYESISNLLHQTRLPVAETIEQLTTHASRSNSHESTIWLSTALGKEGAIPALLKIAAHVPLKDALAPIAFREALIRHDQKAQRTMRHYSHFYSTRGTDLTDAAPRLRDA
ncbi:hypothetical protein C5B99_12340 [Pseudoclavibacter sp. Z016]|nr:hypothetical protein C5B99_12340 [Pseudoclavibacter sp. Z016]